MKYDLELFKNKIYEIFINNQIRYQLNDFPSGCSMIDFWVNEGFFVIQLETERIGFSSVEEPIDFTTTPDKWYYDIDEILNKIRGICQK